MVEKKTTKKSVKSEKKVVKKVAPKKVVKPSKIKAKAKKTTEAKKTSAAKTTAKEGVKSRRPQGDAEVSESRSQGASGLRYYEAVGRRKRAVARVRLFTKGDKAFSINSKTYIEYFKTTELQELANGALKKMKVEDKFSVSALVRGGGISGQAEAVRHGISRALLKFNPDFHKRLKRAGFLRRDPREKERRKFGLKKARKAPQWSKR